MLANTNLENNQKIEQANFGVEKYVAILSGMQEVCPKITRASGKVTAIVAHNTLTVTGHFSNLSGDFTGAHIHFGVAGKNGPVTFVLKPTIAANKKGGSFLTVSNTFILVGEQAWDFKNRRFYVNVHSKKIPSGELRGQLLPEADQYFHANLLGKNEVPANSSQAQGQVVFELRDGYLKASGSFDDFTSEVATQIAGGGHIHVGYSGQNGGVTLLLKLTLDDDKKGGIIKAEDNIFHLTHAQKNYLKREELYINIHSQDNRSGELRGQISSMIKGASYEGDLSGAQEVGPVETNGSGRIFANYDGFRHIRLSGSFKGLSSAAFAAHIHIGKRGRNGGVIHPLKPRYSTDRKSGVFDARTNVYELSRAQIKALFRNELYVNIHSQNFRRGELRAQLVPLTLAACGASFSRTIAEETMLMANQSIQPALPTAVNEHHETSFDSHFNAEGVVKNFTLYPNPVNNEFTLNYGKSHTPTTFTILHVSGKQVMQGILPANSTQHVFEVSHLPSGLYLVSLHIPGAMPITKRLVKQGYR